MDASKRCTIVNDNIHGHIEFSPSLKRIIDTPQVQRLRDLGQLGLVSFVYPGATHTRFAHSLGVCHLAGVFLNCLRATENGKCVTDRDVFLVQVAGLCHDLGHGPFSHLFEKAMSAHYPNRENKWKHEDASKWMFQEMVKVNGLADMFNDAEIRFIQELICSKEEDRKGHPNGDKGKEFLYEIVCNQQTGIDVDKFDYFARDCHTLGLNNPFDCHRFMEMARVVECDDGRTHICVREKELENLSVMFRSRFFLHLYGCRHAVVCGIDEMIRDIFELANDALYIRGDDGKDYNLFDCTSNMGAFAALTDSIISVIRNLRLSDKDSEDMDKVSKLTKAKALIERIYGRRIYKFVFQTRNVYNLEKSNAADIADEINSLSEGMFDKEDICVQIPRFDYGNGPDDPLEGLYVFSQKHPPFKPVLYERDMVSELLQPRGHLERMVRVYCKADDKMKAKAIRKAAEKWESDSCVKR